MFVTLPAFIFQDMLNERFNHTSNSMVKKLLGYLMPEDTGLIGRIYIGRTYITCIHKLCFVMNIWSCLSMRGRLDSVMCRKCLVEMCN